MHTMGNPHGFVVFPAARRGVNRMGLRFDWPTIEIPGTAGIMENTKDRTLHWPRATARRDPPCYLRVRGEHKVVITGIETARMLHSSPNEGMSISITEDRTLEAFAIVVDINDFSQTVTAAEDGSTKGADIADFTRDALEHVIRAIEENEGEVVGIMGDAVFGILPEGAPILTVCEDIAVAVNRESEHISEHRVMSPGDWAYSPGGVSLKICIEFGEMHVTSIRTRYLGNQPLFVGSAINYASRIGAAGEGNRCLIGPVAAEMPEFSSMPLGELLHVPGKRDEPDLEYYELSLKDRWQERTRKQASGGNLV